MQHKEIIFIAGPNGAGKTTFAREFLQIANHARRGQSFSFETTLSGRGYVRLIRQWRSDGYLVVMFFLSLASPEEAIARVAERVAQGGHNIPEDVIRRRFAAGSRNFETLYRKEVDFWRRYNNSGDVLEIIDEGTNP